MINQLNEEAVADIIHRFPASKLKFVRGAFSKEVVLNRANVRMANAANILPDSNSGLAGKSDEATILSTLTIKSLNSKIRVIAYIQDRENLSHIPKAKVDEVLLSDAYAGYLMAAHILTLGVPQTVHELCSDEGNFQLTRHEIPNIFVGKTYTGLAERLREQNAIPLGLGREQEGMDIHNILIDDYSYLDVFNKRKFEQAGRGLSEENRINIQINPAGDTILEKNDFLIIISQRE